MQGVPKTHALDDRWGDAFGVDHGLKRGDIDGQVVFVDAAEGTEVGAQRRAGTLTTVAVDFSSPVTIVITRPFAFAMTDRMMIGVDTTIIARFIGKKEGSVGRNTRADDRFTGGAIGVFNDPVAIRFGVTAHHTDDGRPVIGIGSAPTALIGALPRRVVRIGMVGTFFPPHSGRVHLPRMRFPEGYRLGASRRGSFGSVAGFRPIVCGRG